MHTIDMVKVVRRYFDAIERGDPDGVMAFFAPDVLQEEFPNRLVPDGVARDPGALRDAARRGGQVVAAQRYEIIGAVAHGNHVAVEVSWTATLAVAAGRLLAGGEMRARFAIFLEFRGGLIVRQRNYDCFEPF